MPAPRRLGLAIAAVGTLLVAMFVAPTAFFAIRYTLLDNGPHHRLPSLCAAVDEQHMTVLAGPVTVTAGTDPAGERLTEKVLAGCVWSDADGRERVGATASMFTRTVASSAVDKAKHDFDLDRDTARRVVAASSAAAFRDVTGVGDEAFCRAFSGGGAAAFDCLTRDGNVTLELQVKPPATRPGALDGALDTVIPQAKAILLDVLGHF